MSTIRRAHSSPSMRKYGQSHTTLYSPSMHTTGESPAPTVKRNGKRSTFQDFKCSESELTHKASSKRQPFLVFRPVRPARFADHLPFKNDMESSDTEQNIPAVLLGENGRIEGHFTVPRAASPENRLYPCTIHTITGRRVMRSYPVPMLKACPLPDIPPPPSPPSTIYPPSCSESETELPNAKVYSLEKPALHSLASKNISHSGLDHGLKRRLRSASSDQNIRTQSLHHGAKAGYSRSLGNKAESASTEPNICDSLEMYKLLREEIRISEWRDAFTVFQRGPVKSCKDAGEGENSEKEHPRLSSPFELEETSAGTEYNAQDALKTSEADESFSSKQESKDGTQSSHAKWSMKHFRYTLRPWKQPHYAQSQEDLDAHLMPQNDTVTSSPRPTIASTVKTADTSLGGKSPLLYSHPSISSTPSLSTPWADSDASAPGTSPKPAKPRVSVTRKISSVSLSQAWHGLADASLRYLPKFGSHQEAPKYPNLTRGLGASRPA